jgi:hypothetical protein
MREFAIAERVSGVATQASKQTRPPGRLARRPAPPATRKKEFPLKLTKGPVIDRRFLFR